MSIVTPYLVRSIDSIDNLNDAIKARTRIGRMHDICQDDDSAMLLDLANQKVETLRRQLPPGRRQPRPDREGWDSYE